MEGNSIQPQKALSAKSVITPNSSISPKKEMNEILTRQISKKKEAVKASFVAQKGQKSNNQQNTPPNKTVNNDGYEVRTMQHDIDEAKGKKIQSVNIAKNAPISDNAKKTSINEIDKIKQNTTTSRILTAKEGIIGKPSGFEKKRKEKISLIKKIKYYFAQRKLDKATTPKKTSFMIILVILIFIGGIGYYLYTSGALSSLDGIFQQLFEKNSVIIPTTTPITITSSTNPILPITTTSPTVSISSITTSSTPISTDNQDEPSTIESVDNLTFTPSDAFFNPDSVSVIYLNNLEETFSKLKNQFDNSKVGENKFKRIIIGAKDSFSSISLAQVWNEIRSLALGKNSKTKYSELLSSELIDSWGLAMPNSVYGAISEKYNLFLYGQPEDGLRVVLIFKLDNSNIENNMLSWEKTMVYDLKNIFLGQQHSEASTEEFMNNLYKDIHLRYLNLPMSDLTMDYAILVDKSYLILTTSREAAWATVDRLLKNNVNKLSSNVFTNAKEQYNFQYPSTWKVTINKYDERSCLFGPNADNISGLGGVEVLDGYLSIDEYLNDTQDIQYNDRTDLTLNGISAIEVHYQGSVENGQQVVFLKNDKIYNIYINSEKQQDIELFNQIISTFKFQ